MRRWRRCSGWDRRSGWRCRCSSGRATSCVGVPVLLAWQAMEGRRASGRTAKRDERPASSSPGASGFVGSARGARAWRPRVTRLRLAVRATSRRDNLEGIDGRDRHRATCATATVDDRRRCRARATFSMSPRITGCGRAIPSEIVRNNLEGARAVMEAALNAGVERVVYTSSVAALKPAATATPADETSRHTRGKRHRRLQAQQARGRARWSSA